MSTTFDKINKNNTTHSNSLNTIKCDSVIFDLDGTLWDSTHEIANAWNELLSSKPNINRSPITSEELYSNMGLPMYTIAANLFPELETEVRNALMDEMGIFENDYLKKRGARLYSGITQVISYISKIVPALIVSNCQDGYIEAFLSAHSLSDYFTDYECWGRTGLTKSENILSCIKRNNLQNPIYFGDTSMDMEASKKAGIPFIYAKYGFGDIKNYSPAVSTPIQLLDFLDFQ